MKSEWNWTFKMHVNLLNVLNCGQICQDIKVSSKLKLSDPYGYYATTIFSFLSVLFLLKTFWWNI